MAANRCQLLLLRELIAAHIKHNRCMRLVFVHKQDQQRTQHSCRLNIMQFFRANFVFIFFSFYHYSELFLHNFVFFVYFLLILCPLFLLIHFRFAVQFSKLLQNLVVSFHYSHMIDLFSNSIVDTLNRFSSKHADVLIDQLLWRIFKIQRDHIKFASCHFVGRMTWEWAVFLL